MNIIISYRLGWLWISCAVHGDPVCVPLVTLGMKFKVAHFLVAFVVVTFGLPVLIHKNRYGAAGLTVPFLALAFFLPLNMLICLWEVGLGLHISFIAKEYARLKEKFGRKPFDAVVQFFIADLDMSSIFSLQFWSKTWSTYVTFADSSGRQLIIARLQI